jgi:hypothetical protein
MILIPAWIVYGSRVANGQIVLTKAVAPWVNSCIASRSLLPYAGAVVLIDARAGARTYEELTVFGLVRTTAELTSITD